MGTRRSKLHVYAVFLDTKDAVFFFLAPSDHDALVRSWLLLTLEKKRERIPKAALDNCGLTREKGAKTILEILGLHDKSDQRIWGALKSILEDHPDFYHRVYNNENFEIGVVPRWPKLPDKVVEQLPDIFSANGEVRLTALEEEGLHQILQDADWVICQGEPTKGSGGTPNSLQVSGPWNRPQREPRQAASYRYRRSPPRTAP